jgi:hypothetical protein
MKNRMLWYVAVAALAITALAAAPATAAPPKQRDDRWVGQVVRHQRHFDYRGRACPISAEVCIEVLAIYRIVPLTPQAAFALRRFDGRQAKLVGHLAPATDADHTGTLFVRRVRRP